MSKTKPLFIVFEGIEGCGKSFQSKKLLRNLKKSNFKTILTREPGGTPSAEMIRNLILKDYFSKGQKEKFHKYTDTLLYLAARNEHINNKIHPYIKRKYIVICDRFIDSTYAYQVHGKKVEKMFIENIHKKILGNIKPDITFILTANIIPQRKLHNIFVDIFDAIGIKINKECVFGGDASRTRYTKNKEEVILQDIIPKINEQAKLQYEAYAKKTCIHDPK